MESVCYCQNLLIEYKEVYVPDHPKIEINVKYQSIYWSLDFYFCP